MEHRPVLGDVDVVAREHGVDPLAQAALLGQTHEQLERRRVDAVLRVVEVDALGLDRQRLAAGRVGGEEVAQVPVRRRGVVLLEGLPRRELAQGRSHRRIVRCPA